jgi:16S rRNA (guanine966-N2)-methyltransferase
LTRIVAGDLKGRRLATPPGERTRPTSDRVREALFGSLDAGGDVDGAVVADLYAGSGALGLEALSRGAASAVFVESHPATARVLRRNISDLGLATRAHLVTRALPGALDRPPPAPADLVFADPPYALPNPDLRKVLSALVTGGWLNPEALVIVERSFRSGEVDWPEQFTDVRSRRYGETVLWYGHGSWT